METLVRTFVNITHEPERAQLSDTGSRGREAGSACWSEASAVTWGQARVGMVQDSLDGRRLLWLTECEVNKQRLALCAIRDSWLAAKHQEKG